MSKKQQVELNATKREDLKEKIKAIRARGLVPAVVYGRKHASTAIVVDAKEFRKKVLLSEAGKNLIFNLKIKDGTTETIPVITHETQRDVLSDDIIHIDFLHISMDEKIRTKIKVVFTGGTPIGVKDSGGVLIHGLREIEIRSLPDAIPDKFEIDVSSLEINQSFQVSDLKVGEGVEILSKPDEMIASVTPPTKEEEPAAIPVPETGEVAAPGAEGAPAADAAKGAKPAEGAEKTPADAKGAPAKAAAEPKKEGKPEKK